MKNTITLITYISSFLSIILTYWYKNRHFVCNLMHTCW